VLISDERDLLLDSGGGIQRARPLLGEAPIFVANIDSLWTGGATPPLETLKRAWDPARMDLLLLLVPRGQGIGFEGPQGFLMDAAGRLTHSTSPQVVTPFANVGFGVLKPQILDDQPREGAFSIIPTWRRLQGEGRLFGAVMDAFWMHVGDPAARDAAEARLR
jgi:MurNAc alpha-1-phosphate uridylyltransferase